MSLYAIGDTHLSLGTDKPMDVFGGRWEGYVDKLREGFLDLGPEDVTVLCGDLSWGISLEQARTDWTACPVRRFFSRATTTTGGTPPRR